MFKRLQYAIQKYFGLTRGETNGGLVFMILMLIVLFIPYAWEKWIFTPRPQFTGKRQQTFIDSLEALRKTPESSVFTMPDTQNIKPFRPDTLTFTQWKELGLSDKIARRTLKYLEKGGRFTVRPDLLKIYDFPEKTYQRIKRYIDLPDKISANTSSEKNTASNTASKKSPGPFDLNKANAATFQKINGIGPTYSERIVKFRKLLGGFVEKEQLYEVYGMDSTLVENLLKSVYISSSYRPQMLSVNGAEFSTLLRHPYINYETTKLLVNNRPFSGLKEIKALIQKQGTNWIGLKPYLHVAAKDYTPATTGTPVPDSATDDTD